jgi:hypothetical protein
VLSFSIGALRSGMGEGMTLALARGRGASKRAVGTEWWNCIGIYTGWGLHGELIELSLVVQWEDSTIDVRGHLGSDLFPMFRRIGSRFVRFEALVFLGKVLPSTRPDGPVMESPPNSRTMCVWAENGRSIGMGSCIRSWQPDLYHMSIVIQKHSHEGGSESHWR